MERTQGELRARFADRLRGDDTDRLADLDELGGREVAAVAARTDTATRLAGEHRADLDRLDGGLGDRLGLLLVDLVTRLDEHLLGQGIDDVVDRHAAEDTFGQRFLHVLAFLQGAGEHTADRPAVGHRDDGVLGDVHETTREVAGVGRLQGRVGETLTGAVRRDEVFEDREALAEVRDDRVLDEFAGGAGHALLRLRHETAHAGELTDLLLRASGAGVDHHIERVEAVLGVLEGVEEALGDLVRRARPDVDHLVVALAVRDEPAVVLVLHVLDVAIRLADDVFLLLRDDDILDRDGETTARGVGEAEFLEVVEELRRLEVAAGAEDRLDDLGETLLVEEFVDEPHLLRDDLIEDDASRRGIDELPVDADLDPGVERRRADVIGDDDLLRRGEDLPLPHVAGLRLREVVAAQDLVLRRVHDRRPVRGRQDVVAREHEDARLELGVVRERHVDGHLVAVEVSVEGRTHHRVDADGLAFDQDRLERLDAETVQRGGAVQEHRVPVNDVLQDLPDLGTLLVDHLLGALHRLDQAALDELADDERLEELDRHVLREAALMELELGTDDDDRTAGVVDALTQQVLAEAALLALEHVGERLQGAVVVRADGVDAAGVVEERIDRLLEHALLVPQDDLRRLDLDEALEAVVADDDTAIEIVEVRGREPAAFEGHERTQFRGDDRDDVEHHPLGTVQHAGLALAERLHDAQALEDLLLLLRGVLLLRRHTELCSHRLDVRPAQQVLDGVAADLGDELLLLGVVEVLVLVRERSEDIIVLLLGEEVHPVETGGPGLDHHVRLVVDDPLEVLTREAQDVGDLGRRRLEVPDVHDRHGEGDVPHALAAHALLGHLDAAAVADDALVADALVLAAVALPVADRAEDLLTEEAVLLRTERPVVDRLRLRHLPV